MKIKVYKHIVMFLLPAALTGCSGKEDSLPGTGQPQYRYGYGPCSGKGLRHGAAR